MKKLLAICLLLLPSCGFPLNWKDWKACELVCAGNGGIDYCYDGFPVGREARCNNKAVFNAEAIKDAVNKQ